MHSHSHLHTITRTATPTYLFTLPPPRAHPHIPTPAYMPTHIHTLSYPAPPPLTHKIPPQVRSDSAPVISHPRAPGIFSATVSLPAPFYHPSRRQTHRQLDYYLKLYHIHVCVCVCACLHECTGTRENGGQRSMSPFFLNYAPPIWLT